MNKTLFQFGIGAVIIAAIAVLGLLFIRLIPFDTSDVVISIDAPREFDIGSDAEIHVTVVNGTRATLREGSIVLDLPASMELLSSRDTAFESLKPRAQATAIFVVQVIGKPGTFTDISARADFRPRQLSATFTKETTISVLLRDLPLDIDFMFPMNITAGSSMTFTIRIASDTTSPIGPVGVELVVPLEFRIERMRPKPADAEELRWDFGDVDGEFREEIQITGKFDLDAEEGEFLARIGMFDKTRLLLKSFRQTRETVRLRSGDIVIDVEFDGIINPQDATIEIGEDVVLLLRYRNTTSDPVDDVVIELVATHESIKTRDIEASEPFTRSLSGAYIWSAPTVAKLNQVQPKEEGEITITFPLEPKLTMEAFSDANQTIIARARAISGGRILAERQVQLRFAGQLAVEGEVRYFKAPGGSNTGPLPPKVGETTTYTVALSIEGGTNGIENTIARLLLGKGVVYVGPVDPIDLTAPDTSYNMMTREFTWDVGALSPGVGTLSSKRLFVFRIGFIPTSDMVGTFPTLLETITVAGRDTYVDRILDASDKPVDTVLHDDPDVKTFMGRVEAASSSVSQAGDDENEKGE